MLILGINRILNWLQITTGGKSYTCPTKEINDELFFKFKNEWHRATDYVSEHTMELISEAGRISLINSKSKLLYELQAISWQ